MHYPIERFKNWIRNDRHYPARRNMLLSWGIAVIVLIMLFTQHPIR
jgi:hypothetical protein